MKIESIRIQNYKVFRKVEIKDIPNMAVFLGKNGVGKTTFFDVFGFLHDCLNSNVKAALAKRGGFKEVISRDQTGDIAFIIKFRPSHDEPLMTYEVSIGLDDAAKAVVKKEVLRFRRGQKGAPWKVLEFSYGEGIAAEGALNSYEDVSLATRRRQKLDSPDILAIKGLGQFKEFEAVSTFRRLIEDWYVADFRIDAARARQEAGYSEQLSRTGDNLSSVTKYIYAVSYTHLRAHETGRNLVCRLLLEKKKIVCLLLLEKKNMRKIRNSREVGVSIRIPGWQ